MDFGEKTSELLVTFGQKAKEKAPEERKVGGMGPVCKAFRRARPQYFLGPRKRMRPTPVFFFSAPGQNEMGMGVVDKVSFVLRRCFSS